MLKFLDRRRYLPRPRFLKQCRQPDHLILSVEIWHVPGQRPQPGIDPQGRSPTLVQPGTVGAEGLQTAHPCVKSSEYVIPFVAPEAHDRPSCAGWETACSSPRAAAPSTLPVAAALCAHGCNPGCCSGVAPGVACLGVLRGGVGWRRDVNQRRERMCD